MAFPVIIQDKIKVEGMAFDTDTALGVANPRP